MRPPIRRRRLRRFGKKVKANNGRLTKKLPALSGELVNSNAKSTSLFQAANLWQFGDWAALANLGTADVSRTHKAGKIALLSASANLQQGAKERARELLRQAKKSGCSSREIVSILVAGAHLNLGCASYLMGRNNDRSCNHFQLAAKAAFGPERSLGSERVIESEQLSQLGISTVWRKSHSSQSALTKKKINVTSLELGDAWAGNTINTVIFRHHGLMTYRGNQYTAFYVDSQTLRLIQRDLTSDAIQMFDLSGEYNLFDSHNSISLGVDRNGYLHISYDHHASELSYRRSSRPEDITAWSEEIQMAGNHEDQVTYPTFILPRQQFPLTFLYRDGWSENGGARIMTYDEIKEEWRPCAHAVLSGAEQKPWSSNPYWNHPAVGTDGSLHLTFVWRTHTLGKAKRINNINIGYARSFDNGMTWATSLNQPYRLPITQVNAETIHAVSPGSNLINQTSMALDSKNRPHVAFYANDPDGIPQYQHLWFDGKVWHHRIISKRSRAFSLEGAGTLRVPISRPEILIDWDDNVYVITRGDHTRNRMAVTLLSVSNHALDRPMTEILIDKDVGHAEPVIDRERWNHENVLSILMQHNEQPSGDKGCRAVSRGVSIVDCYFSM